MEQYDRSNEQGQGNGVKSLLTYGKEGFLDVGATADIQRRTNTALAFAKHWVS